jgi:hypothetical protein
VLKHYRQPEKYPYPPSKSPLLSETVALLEACGLDDPLHKVSEEWFLRTSEMTLTARICDYDIYKRC